MWCRLLVTRCRMPLRFVMMLMMVAVVGVVVMVSVHLTTVPMSRSHVVARGEEGGDQDHTESKLRAGQNLHEHTPHNSGEKGPASIEDKAVSTGDTSPETKDESGKTEIKSPGTEVKPAAAVLKSAIAEGKSADTDGRNAAATKDSSSNVDQPTDSEGDEVTAELKERRRQMDEVCASQKRVGQVSGVFVNNAHHLAYCFVPKTGCTFWKQVFGFLNNDTGLKTHLRSPFDIPRLHIHLYHHSSGESWMKVKDKVQNHFRFMFSRDPYTRLWSAYLDKFYLPDFWVQFGGTVLKRRTPRPSERDLSCGNNVTFAEFISFSLTSNEPHWNPVVRVCDPCQFKPDLLGKMDTYSRDARVVLNHAGLDWLLEDVDHDQHVRHELEMLVQYNFQVLTKKTPQVARLRCISQEGLARRLWTVFQYNGYISEAIPFPSLAVFTVDAFRDSVLGAFNKSVGSAKGREDLRQQKHRAMRAAFRGLPQDILKKLAARYDLDFRMFGYTAMNFDE